MAKGSENVPPSSGRPFLRWAGSKRALIPAISDLIPPYRRYVEPFAGSGCLFFHLRPPRAILGDLNRHLIHTFRVVKRSPYELYRCLEAMPRTSEHYYRVRAVDPATLDEIERAAHFIYLNRNCFNGVYRTNRAGLFNVPLGTNTGRIPSLTDFLSCSHSLRRATLKCGDFDDTVGLVRAGDLVYLDPPYPSKGRPAYGEYGYGSFAEGDLDRLVGALQRIDALGAQFIMSYRDSSKLLMRAPWSMRRVTTWRHVSGFAEHRKAAKEILVFNFDPPAIVSGASE